MTQVTITIPTTDPKQVKEFENAVNELTKELAPKGIIKLHEIYKKDFTIRTMVKAKLK